MNILAIECTHEALSAAVSRSGVVTEATCSEWKKAAESLVPLVEQVMAESRLKRQELECIAISAGPGSFTALRIGMSVAKGIAYGLGIPLVPVPTMPAMAATLRAADGIVMAAIPSRKGEYYYASYCSDDLSSGVWHEEVQRGSATDVASAAEVLSRSGEVVVVGRRLIEVPPLLACSGAVYKEADLFSARSLFSSAERLFGGADAAELNGVTPHYFQMFSSPLPTG
ncbi:MAG: tRNA (adenosine(37)-N6)-threonylcarbamoyltransferase complex dimerization subunit type 1 TsaB [Chlorobium sp.]|nr:MAG: tRNA (adenosine(37)-N6)-threonylcarbamoyltransferase complex dimerization subunit type 1 TsaB [Chlorobium sp.]